MRNVKSLRDAEIGLGQILDRVEKLERIFRPGIIETPVVTPSVSSPSSPSTIESADAELSADGTYVTHKLNHNFLHTVALPSETYLDGVLLIPGGFSSRGDPTTPDKSIGDFTTDNNWHDLDLSGIVPVGAKSILLRLLIAASTVGAEVDIRLKGYGATSLNIGRIVVYTAGASSMSDLIIPCDSTRMFEYRISNIAWSSIYLIVAGWWKG